LARLTVRKVLRCNIVGHGSFDVETRSPGWPAFAAYMTRRVEIVHRQSREPV